MFRNKKDKKIREPLSLRNRAVILVLNERHKYLVTSAARNILPLNEMSDRLDTIEVSANHRR